MDTSTAEISKSEITYVYMLVVWKVKDSKHSLYVALVEHTKEFIWDENELKRLYNKNHSRLKEYDDIMSDTWFINNNMVLKTSFEARGLK
jgi:hypothetical protein